MKRFLFLLTLLLALAPAFARAQLAPAPSVREGTTLPASCGNLRVLFHLTQTDGANAPGLYRCNGSAFVSVGGSFTGGTITSPILGANGAVGAPTFSFSGETGLGAYRKTAATYAVAAGGVDIFKVDAAFTYAINNLYVGGGQLQLGSTGDVNLFRDAANTFALRNGTSAQRARVYNRFTDVSNGEWFSVDWQSTSNVAEVGTKANGTGTVRPMRLLMDAGSVVWRTGTGTPEGVVTAGVGPLFTRTDGGAGTTLYVKESGAGNTGWVAK